MRQVGYLQGLYRDARSTEHESRRIVSSTEMFNTDLLSNRMVPRHQYFMLRHDLLSCNMYDAIIIYGIVT